MIGRAVLAAAALAALAACGGGGGGAATADSAARTDTASSSASAPGTELPDRRVLVIGDSNLFESGEMVDAALQNAGFEPTLRGVPSLGLKDWDAYWRGELDGLLTTDPAVIVVALGTNDATDAGDIDAFPTRLDSMMRVLGARPVVWVTHVRVRPFEVRGGGEAVNDAIRSATARWPNLSVLDLAPVLSEDPSLLRDDRLHFTERGMARFAAEIAVGAAQATAVPVAP